MKSGSKVLVTGSTGLIGANLVKKLLALDTNIKATYHIRPPIIIDDRIEYIRCDLTNFEDCKKIVKDVDYVFMCAANTSGAAAIARNPMQHVTSNIVMNSQMLEAAYLAFVEKFIWISSSVVYSPSDDVPVKESEFLQSDPYESYYTSGWMKRYTEVLCRTYSEKLQRRMPCVVIRPSNVYGPYDKFDFETSHAAAALIRRVVERQDPIIVWGDGNDVRDLVFVDDLVEAILLAAQKIASYDPVNVGLGKGYTIRSILEALIEIDDYKNARILFDPSKPSTIPIRLLNIEKAKNILGFYPKVDIFEGLRKTLKWYRESRSQRSLDLN